MDLAPVEMKISSGDNIFLPTQRNFQPESHSLLENARRQTILITLLLMHVCFLHTCPF